MTSKSVLSEMSDGLTMKPVDQALMVELSRTEVWTLLGYGKQFMEADSPLDNTDHAILEAKMYRAGCASGFVTCLARTFESADEKHLVRLHSIFPEFGAALWKMKTDAAFRAANETEPRFDAEKP